MAVDQRRGDLHLRRGAGEAQVGKTVVLAGNVVRVNQITTKKGIAWPS